MKRTNEFSFILKPSQHGVGVFATHDIDAGTHLRLFVDEDSTKYESRELNKEDVPNIFKGHYLDRGDIIICPPDYGAMPIGWYVNHSNDPNGEPGPNPNQQRRYRWYASRDIKDGEEILFDYNHLDEPGKYFFTTA